MNTNYSLSSRQGFNNQLHNASGGYASFYGLGLHGIFKPLNTNTAATGIAHYKSPNIIENTNPTGTFGATSSGLNPFGVYTRFEGLIHGTNLPSDLDGDSPDPLNARPFGIKNPANVVGWGFDIFGYPSPNYCSGWSLFGSLTGNYAPSGSFATTGGFTTSGNSVAQSDWLAGPLDLRWDQHRGVWCGWNGGVCAGKVVNVTISGDTYSSSGSYYAETVRYDVLLNDGLANSMMLTDVVHIGPKPTPSSYKVFPLQTGDFCFIVHHFDRTTNTPKFAVWMIEPPGVDECAGLGTIVSNSGVGFDAPDIYQGAGEGDPLDSTKLLTGSGLYHGLRIYPLPLEMGGLGTTSISSGQILVGSTGNQFVAKNLVAGTGLSLNTDGFDATLSLSTGVAFIAAGVNENITEIRGLNVPLSLAQGGTGASGKIFVDISGNQSILGTKTFHTPLIVPTSTISNPSIKFGVTNDGITRIASGINNIPSIVFVHSGLPQVYLTSSGVRFKQRLHIYNDITDGYDVPLIVQAHNAVGATGNMAGSGRTIANDTDLIQVRQNDGTTFGVINSGGYIKLPYFHSTGLYTADTPFIANQSSTPQVPGFKINHNNLTQIQFDPSGDTLRLNMSKTTQGYMKFAGPSGSSVGYLDLSANSSYAGGIINMAAGNNGAGGNLVTNDGGGNINTKDGIIELGPSGNRIILNKPSLSTNLNMDLPSSGSIITTKEYVDAKTAGITAGGGGTNGLNVVLNTYGYIVESGTVLYTLTYVSGVLTDYSFTQVIFP